MTTTASNKALNECDGRRPRRTDSAPGNSSRHSGFNNSRLRLAHRAWWSVQAQARASTIPGRPQSSQNRPASAASGRSWRRWILATTKADTTPASSHAHKVTPPPVGSAACFCGSNSISDDTSGRPSGRRIVRRSSARRRGRKSCCQRVSARSLDGPRAISKPSHIHGAGEASRSDSLR